MTKKVKLLLVSILIVSVIYSINISYAYRNNVSSFDYKILDNIIYAVPTSYEFKVEELLNNLNYVGDAIVYNIDNETLNNDDVVGTGCTLSVNNVSYDIVVLGDVTGDGLIEIGDVAKLYNHYRGGRIFDGIDLEAGMLTDSQKVDIGDIAKLYNFYRGKKAFTYYSYNLYSLLLDKKVNIKLINDNETNISNGYIKYDSVLVPMDEVLSNMLDNYDLNKKQEYTYKNKTFKIDLDNNIIIFDDIRTIDSYINISEEEYTFSSPKTLDYSINVEIENIDNVNYIPIHFLAYFDNVGITVDNRSVYSGDNYLRAIDAININSDDCNVVINFNIENSSFNDLFKEEAYKRIEKYRKEEVKVIVKDKDGNLLNDSKINLNMVSNDFKFGTSIRVNSSNGKNNLTNIDNDVFSAIGCENAFKWSSYYNNLYNGYTAAREVTNYAVNNNLYLRGHYLWSDLNNNPIVNGFTGSETNQEPGTMIYIYNEYNSGRISLDEANQLIDELKIRFEQAVLDHVEEEISSFPEVREWDVTNEFVTTQFFKHYLYDKALLTTNSFISEKKYEPSKFTSNEEYERFMARLYDKARSVNPNVKLVMNENYITGSNSKRIDETIRIASAMKQYTNNIDSFGVQYHVYNHVYATPVTYYNQINRVVKETGIDDIIVTEYDDFVDDKLGKYTELENIKRAQYLEDTLISVYSNTNIREFIFWVFNSTSGNFSEEQRNVYKLFMKEWLHDKKNGSSDIKGEYVTNLHKGQYNLEVKYGNKTKQQLITVKDNMDTIEIVVD